MRRVACPLLPAIQRSLLRRTRRGLGQGLEPRQPEGGSRGGTARRACKPPGKGWRARRLTDPASPAARKASQHGRHGKCYEKRRKSGDDRPDGEGEERRVLARRSGKQPTNVGCEREAEGPESDRPGRMQRRRTRRTSTSIVLDPVVRRAIGRA